MRIVSALLAATFLGISACATSAAPDADQNIELGDIEGDALGADNWGAATTCKTLLPANPLKSPSIVISLDGLSLHLWDREGDYDRVFPVGLGKYENEKSLTITGNNFVADLRGPDAVDGTYGKYYSCRVWWTDADASTADSPVKRPVFAGLPFIRFSGAYAIHGPIDNFTNSTGGTLRRGFVSHGCSRMSVEGIKEVYSRIIGRKVPVRVQKEVERRADGTVVDIAAPFIGSECSTDAECRYTGGQCLQMGTGVKRSCTKSCTSSCPDSSGRPTTFCQRVGSAGAGYCVPQDDLIANGNCDAYEGRLARVSGASNGTRSRDVCGAVGDPGTR